MNRKLYTLKETAELLRITEKNIKNPVESVRYLIRAGKLNCIKVCGQRLITEKELDNYLTYCTVRSQ